jgi:mono/diheme cytochrome c family protein
VYAGVRGLWEEGDAPDPEGDPSGYARAFEARYGLHPAPYENGGLPLGLARARDPQTGKTGIQVTCLMCHGGSIGGTSYVGLGNSQLDLERLLHELTRAEGRKVPPSLFVLNSTRGTNNAGMIAASLLSVRNADMSFRAIPLRTGAWIPELDTPAWWILHKKKMKYYDGRTDARATRSNMQFLLGDLTREQLEGLDGTFRDIDAYLKRLRAPKYPFAIDGALAERGRGIFEAHCARCHGTYGEDWTYPGKIVPLDVIGTDPERAKGLTEKFIAHYNATWLGSEYPVEEPMAGYQAPPLDGIWATAPYLHNGTVPTLEHVLNSASRPRVFTRPPGTGFEHYDQARVGWKYEERSAEGSAPGKAGDKRVVDTRRWGLSNAGHTFGDKLTGEERRAVIEYLKGL